MIDAVVFDFDGVIVESADIKTEAFRALFADGHPGLADEIVAYHLSNEGISRYDKFRHIYAEMLNEPLSHEQEIALGDRFSELVFEAIIAAPFVPGAVEFLQANPASRPLFIVSGTPEEELRLIARTRGVDGYFKEIHGTPRKKPELVEGILERYGFSRDRVAFIGDADSDRKAAHATGLRFIARVVPGGAKDLDGEAQVPDLTTLEEVLQSL